MHNNLIKNGPQHTYEPCDKDDDAASFNSKQHVMLPTVILYFYMVML